MQVRVEKYLLIEKLPDGVRVSGDHKVNLGYKFDEQGVFAEWEWDGTELSIRNDRFGCYPLFFAQEADRFAVSPSISKLLELGFGSEIDLMSLGLFLRIGSLIGNDTLFSNIKAFPPACSAKWRRAGFSIETAESRPWNKIDVPKEEACRLYVDVFQRAVERHLDPDEEVAVPLSGGRDSRHIALAIDRSERAAFTCFTAQYPPPSSNSDLDMARRLCSAMDVEHIAVPFVFSKFASEIYKNKLLGFVTDEHGWYVPLAAAVEGRFSSVFDGLGGDVLSAGLFLTKERHEKYCAGRYIELADDIIGPDGYASKIGHRNIREATVREHIIDYVAAELKRFASHHNPVSAFFFWNRTRRCVAMSPFRFYSSDTKVVVPYLDHEVFDLLTSLPAEYFFDHAFHSKAIEIGYPKFAQIPYASRLDREPSIPYLRRLARDLVNYSLSSRRRQLIDRKFLVSRYILSSLSRNTLVSFAGLADLATVLLQLERLDP